MGKYIWIYFCLFSTMVLFASALSDPQEPYLVPNTKGCKSKCGGAGSCPTFCGKGGYCCKKGKSTCPKSLADLNTVGKHACIRDPTETAITTTIAPTGPYLVPNTKDCKTECGGPGSCPTYCGKGGYCCKKGKSSCPKSLADLNTLNKWSCIRDPTGTAITTTIAPTGPYLVPNTKDCKTECGGPGSCPTYCGKGGYCCKKGKSTCPKALADLNTLGKWSCIRDPTGLTKLPQQPMSGNKTAQGNFTTCKRMYIKKGCYHQSFIANERLLISDRDFKGIELDWSNFGKSIHSLACRCSDEARSNGYKFFSLRFWAECWGKTVTTVQAMKLNDVTLKETKCADQHFKVCDDKDPSECVGKALYDYLYQI